MIDIQKIINIFERLERGVGHVILVKIKKRTKKCCICISSILFKLYLIKLRFFFITITSLFKKREKVNTNFHNLMNTK